jgi:hypothetical protein
MRIGTKIDQMGIKFTNIFLCKTLQNFPNLDFWFENIPSGNLALTSDIEEVGFSLFLSLRQAHAPRHTLFLSHLTNVPTSYLLPRE